MAALCVTVALFIASSLIPLAFRTTAESVSELSYGVRSVVFAKYWSGDSSDMAVRQLTSPGKKYIDFCTATMDGLVARATLDRAEVKVESQGSEYTSVTSADGVEINVCRMWRQTQGDWRNWTDVCFDMDTGEVYYLYLSNECIFNAAQYAGALYADTDTEKVAELIAAELGYDLRYLDWSGDDAEAGTAFLVTEGSATCMEISCIYHESMLLDVRISCS